LARYKLVALCNAAEGREDDFNEWYDKQHMADVLAIPGFVSAERFTCIGNGPNKYMAIYEIETDDFAVTLEEFRKRPGTELMPLSDAMDMTSVQVGFWQPYGK